MRWTINDVDVTADDGISYEEARNYVRNEIHAYSMLSKQVASVHIAIVGVGEDVEITTVEKSPIRRIRRITGYLSDLDNFGAAKRQECSERVKHM